MYCYNINCDEDNCRCEKVKEENIYKLYLSLKSNNGKETTKIMFVDEKTISKLDIYGEAILDMFNILNTSKNISPTPLEVDLSPQDKVFN